jgi:hypothetical protein
MSGLSPQVVPVDRLTAAQVDALYALFDTYYEGADPGRFRADLFRKQRVILLSEPDGRIRGFSTLRMMTPAETGRDCRILYSGDTVVDRRFWGGKALQLGFTRNLLRERLRDPVTPLYWMLTTKGYRTYLLLTNYFPASWPRHDLAMPDAVRALRDSVASMRYGDAYDPSRGVVVVRDLDRLREGVAEITGKEHQVPHIRFFEQVNPNHAQGEELVCLARIRRRDPLLILAKLAKHRVARR